MSRFIDKVELFELCFSDVPDPVIPEVIYETYQGNIQDGRAIKKKRDERTSVSIILIKADLYSLPELIKTVL